MHRRTVVITGANSGIGLETSVALARAGARVVMGNRNPQKSAAAVEVVRERSGSAWVESRPLDLCDLDSVRAFSDGLTDLDRIDVLINNAGLILDTHQMSPQGIEATFATNHLGPFLLTKRLLDQLHASPTGRVVTLASVAHRWSIRGLDWDRLEHRRPYNGWWAYGQSKLANILFTRELARRTEGTNLRAHAVHPGSVKSGFGRGGDLHGFNDRLVAFGEHILITAERGARTSVHVASSADALRTSGDYWVRSTRSRPAPWARNDDSARRLWELSEELAQR